MKKECINSTSLFLSLGLSTQYLFQLVGVYHRRDQELLEKRKKKSENVALTDYTNDEW